jgi:hypothetical protein
MSVSATQSVSSTSSIESLIPTLPSENAATAVSTSKLHMFGADDDSPSFWDLLDVVNPLQHIPIINHLYREATDDKIGVGARLVGGALFSGVLGLAGAAFNCVLEESTGNDVGGHILALFRDDPATDTGTRLAEATPAPAQPQQLAKVDTADLGDLIGSGPAPKPSPDSPTATSSVPPTASSSAPPTSAPPPTAAPLAAVATAPLTPDTSTASAAAAAAAGTAEMASRSTRMGRNVHDMPTPARTIPLATQSPPALGMAISSTTTRSNVPVTGRRPTQSMIAASSGRTMVEAQEGGSSTPAPAPAAAVPLTPSSSSSSSSASGTAANPPDWFVAAMSQGLDKYDRSAKRAATQTDASP